MEAVGWNERDGATVGCFETEGWSDGLMETEGWNETEGCIETDGWNEIYGAIVGGKMVGLTLTVASRLTVGTRQMVEWKVGSRLKAEWRSKA